MIWVSMEIGVLEMQVSMIWVSMEIGVLEMQVSMEIGVLEMQVSMEIEVLVGRSDAPLFHRIDPFSFCSYHQL
jgi:hypothetical protein